MEIYIAKPCSEKLENMLTSTEGYFCLNCQKKVIDFTKKTDVEIQMYMEEAENPVCGMFLNSQLNRPLQTTWQEKTLEKYFAIRFQKKKSLWNSVYATALYIVLLLSGCKVENSSAQIVTKPIQEQNIPKKDTLNHTSEENNAHLMAFGCVQNAEYEGGINVLRKTIQELLYAKIPENERTKERTYVQFTVNEEGKIKDVTFVKNPPTEYIQEIIKDILYNKLEKFIPAHNHKGEPVKTRKILPIQI